MKGLLLLFLFFGLVSDNLNKAAQVNQQVTVAQQYYESGQYHRAAGIYLYLIDSLTIQDPELILNLAHATFLNGESNKAQILYTRLSKQPDPFLKSTAFNQLGVLYFRKNNAERALYHFRKALIENASNETARFNFELTQKYLNKNPAVPRNKNPKPAGQTDATPAQNSEEGNSGSSSDNNQQDKANESQKPMAGTGTNLGNRPGNSPEKKPEVTATGQGHKTPAGETGNTQGINQEAEDGNDSKANKNKGGTSLITDQEKQMQTLRARLRTTDLSPEKAAMILEAMRQAELQYLLQLPKKQVKPRNSSRPDW